MEGVVLCLQSVAYKAAVSGVKTAGEGLAGCYKDAKYQAFRGRICDVENPLPTRTRASFLVLPAGQRDQKMEKARERMLAKVPMRCRYASAPETPPKSGICLARIRSQMLVPC